jgi:TonB family protein
MHSSTVIRRTQAGDAELAAPANGLSLTQRRFLTLLDTPGSFDELARRHGLDPGRLDRDLARLERAGMIVFDVPAAANESDARPALARRASMSVARRLSLAAVPLAAAAIAWFAWHHVAAPPAGPPLAGSMPTAQGAIAGAATTSVEPVPIATRVLRGDPAERTRDAKDPRAQAKPAEPRAVPESPALVPPSHAANAPEHAANAGVHAAGTAAPDAPAQPKGSPTAPPVSPTAESASAFGPSAAPAIASPPAATTATTATASPPASAPSTPASAPSTPASAPSTAASPPSTSVGTPSTPASAAAPTGAVASPPPAPPNALERSSGTPPQPGAPQSSAAAIPARIPERAPAKLVPIAREAPGFPREAIAQGLDTGNVRARLSVDAQGAVTGIEILESSHRAFERAVRDALARWQFAPGESGRSTTVDIAFKRD